jgi:hypothetical protein
VAQHAWSPIQGASQNELTRRQREYSNRKQIVMSAFPVKDYGYDCLAEVPLGTQHFILILATEWLWNLN